MKDKGDKPKHPLRDLMKQYRAERLQRREQRQRDPNRPRHEHPFSGLVPRQHP